MRKLKFIVVLVVAALALSVTAGNGATGTKPASTSWKQWDALLLSASSVPFFSGKVEMNRSRTADTIRLETLSTAKFMGMRLARSKTISEIDARTGRSRSLESYSRKRGRRYRFHDDRYTVERIMPPEGADGFSVGLDRWDVTSTQDFPYPLEESGEPAPVFDYYGMLLQLERSELSRLGDEVTLYVATSRGPAPFRVVISETRRREITLRGTQPAEKKKRKIEVQEFRLRIIPADPERADEGFMRMEGETELWVEAESKTLLHLSGRAPKVPGQLQLTLSAMNPRP